MYQGRLNHTIVLHLYKDDLELNSVANESVQESEHQFGKLE